MGKSNNLVHSFNSGELSSSGLARVDKEKVRLCAEIQENLFPYTIGKAIMRPGTKFLTSLYASASIDNTPPRIIPFAKTIDIKSILVLMPDGTLKVVTDDTVIAYGAVTSTVGDFTTFTQTLTGGATASVAAGSFTLRAPNLGDSAVLKKQVSTSSAGSEHALHITVSHGSIGFRVGSTDGGDDYIGITELGEGEHILSFTPSGSYWIRFNTESTTSISVTGCYIYNSSAIDLAVPAPWAGTDLRRIRYDQSIDVVFMTIPDNPPYKVERRGDKSWSVVKFITDNGPMMTAISDNNVTLTPSATMGDITVTASGNLFKSYHEGLLFRIGHQNYNTTTGISAVNKYTGAFKVTGVVNGDGSVSDRDFYVTTTGTTWTATLQVQRAYDTQDYGYKLFAAYTITTNTSVHCTPGSYDNNAITWMRVKCTSHTTGIPKINLSYDGYGKTGVVRIKTVSSATSATADVVSELSDTSASDEWLEGEWSSNRGFPTAVAFFDGRLWFARNDRFWGSESDNYYAFDETVEGDAASIQRDVATGGTLADIQWMLPLQRLIFGTSGTEASARSDALDAPLTATNITIKDASNQGAAPINPVKIDGRGLYIQRSGRKLMELGYNSQGYDYTPTDLTRYNEGICTSLKGARISGLVDYDVVELASQRHPQTYIFAPRDDSVCPMLIYEPQQETLGWFRMILGKSYAPDTMQSLSSDKIVSITSVPSSGEDIVYMVVQRRYTNGSNDYYAYYLERLGRHDETSNNVVSTASTGEVKTYNGLYQADSYATATVASDCVTVSTPTHLRGSTVIVIGAFHGADGTVTGYGPIGEYEATGTTIILPYDPYRAGETVTVGLPYYGRYKSAKLAYGSGAGGTALNQLKRVDKVGLIMSDFNPSGVLIGSDFDDANAMDSLPAIERGEPVVGNKELVSHYDGEMFTFPGIWDTDCRVCIEVLPGYSATLNAIVVGVDLNEN